MQTVAGQNGGQRYTGGYRRVLRSGHGESGILNNEIYAGMVIVIAVTTLMPPFAMKGLYSRLNDRMQPSNRLD
jgi:Kef-type K+ transport system membrane component KefB